MKDLPSDLQRLGPKEFLAGLESRDEERQQGMRTLFAHELTHVDKALEVQLQGFQAIANDDTGAAFGSAVQLLLTRAFNHQLAARRLLLMGYVTEAASILARAVETNWLACYFDCYPDEIDRWRNKRRRENGQLSPRELRNGLRRAQRDGETRFGGVDSQNDLYQDLCEVGHANFYGSIWHVYVQSETPPRIELLLGGYGSPRRTESLREVFRCLMRVQMHSLATMAAVDQQFLGDDSVWDAQASAIVKNLAECMND